MQLIPVVQSGIKFIEGAFARARAAGELTPEQEAAYQAHQKAVFADPAAQIEPDPVRPAPPG